MAREALASAVVALLVFANTLSHGFTYDDASIVEGNPLVTAADPAPIFTSPYWPEVYRPRNQPASLYRPVTTLTYWANTRLFGPGPFSFHLVNVLLHAAVCALVARLAFLLTGRRRVALLAGLLFAVHPLHTEAVAGVVGRAELLSALFWLSALVLWIRHPLLGSLAVFPLALAGYLSKEVAITLPAAILAVAWCRGTLRSRETVTALASACLAALVFFAARSAVLGAVLDTGSGTTYWYGGSTAVRLATALVAFARYALLFVFPLRLSAEYSFDQIPTAGGLSDPRALAGLVLLGAAVWAVSRLLRSGRRSAAALGWTLFLVAYLPVSNFLYPLVVILAERLFYLPSVGVTLALAALAARGIGRAGGAGVVVAGAVLLLLAGRSVERNAVWANDGRLFEQTVRDAPRCAVAWLRLGQIRDDQGRPEEARRCYEKALAILPSSYGAHDGLGQLAIESESWEEALEHFRDAARANPRAPAPLYNAGIVHLRAGNTVRAREAFEAALRLDPRHALSVEGLAAAWQTAGVRYAASGRLAEAEETLTQGIERVRELGGDTSSMERVRDDVRRERVDSGAP